VPSASISGPLFRALKDAPVVAILRRPKIDLQFCVEALISSGIRLIEITMDSDQAEPLLRSKKPNKTIFFGAGTITTMDRAKKALFAGAQFFVTPNFNPEVIHFAREHGVPIFAGAMTPTEIFAAYNAGANAIKVFPAGTLGAQYFREIRGPLADIPLVATGGITVANAASFFEAGAIAVGVGSVLIPKDDRIESAQAIAKVAEQLLAASRKER
jgi:2-dehydro-3-deoxyphosphogluconate aldolase/(4S)-4-hydroxy-2-oxoglutarate aldolase